MSKTNFSSTELQILKKELDVRIDDYLEYLEDYDEDEEIRERVHLLQILYSNLHLITVDENTLIDIYIKDKM